MMLRFRFCSALGMALMLAHFANLSMASEPEHKPSKVDPKVIKHPTQHGHVGKQGGAPRLSQNNAAHAQAHGGNATNHASHRVPHTKPLLVSSSASRPETLAIREQINILRAEEKAAVSNIRARYNAVMRYGHMTLTQRDAESRALAEEEAQYLALAASPADKNAVHAQYDLLRRVLRGKSKLDKGLMNRLVVEKNSLIKRVQSQYQAKIATLERSNRRK